MIKFEGHVHQFPADATDEEIAEALAKEYPQSAAPSQPARGMQRFEITGPDGARYEMTAPDEAAAREAVQKMFGGPAQAAPAVRPPPGFGLVRSPAQPGGGVQPPPGFELVRSPSQSAAGIDTAKIKRNIKRMIDQGASEQEIDLYVDSTGATPEMLRAAPALSSAPAPGQRLAKADGTIEIKLFDGTILKFPAGTSQDIINRVVREQTAKRRQPASSPPDPSTLTNEELLALRQRALAAQQPTPVRGAASAADVLLQCEPPSGKIVMLGDVKTLTGQTLNRATDGLRWDNDGFSNMRPVVQWRSSDPQRLYVAMGSTVPDNLKGAVKQELQFRPAAVVVRDENQIHAVEVSCGTVACTTHTYAVFPRLRMLTFSQFFHRVGLGTSDEGTGRIFASQCRSLL